MTDSTDAADEVAPDRAAASSAVAVESTSARRNDAAAHGRGDDPEATARYDELPDAVAQELETAADAQVAPDAKSAGDAAGPAAGEVAAGEAAAVGADRGQAAGAGNARRPGRRSNGAAVRELDVDDLLVEVRPAAAPPAPRVTPAVNPPTRAQVRAARRLQARKVGRLVRHIDLWSLLKVSLLFYVCMLLVGAVAGVLVWSALQRSGAVGSVEGFIEEIFLVENFRFEGAEMFRIAVLGGLVGVLVATLLTVLGGLLFNLISDLTGGVRVSVVQLESARPAPRRGAR